MGLSQLDRRDTEGRGCPERWDEPKRENPGVRGARKCLRARGAPRASAYRVRTRARMNGETGTEGASERVISTFCGFAYVHRFSDFLRTHSRIVQRRHGDLSAISFPVSLKGDTCFPVAIPAIARAISPGSRESRSTPDRLRFFDRECRKTCLFRYNFCIVVLQTALLPRRIRQNGSVFGREEKRIFRGEILFDRLQIDLQARNILLFRRNNV